MHKRRSKNPALAAALARAGMTGKALAAECGLHRVTVSNTLNCRVVPKVTTALAIARALGTTPRHLGFAGKEG